MTTLHVPHPHVPRGPLTRAGCREWIYPCRLSACRFNLGHVDKNAYASDRHPEGGCALDVAEAGPSGLEAIASALGLSDSTVLDLEFKALRKLAKRRATKVLQRESAEHVKAERTEPDHGGEE